MRYAEAREMRSRTGADCPGRQRSYQPMTENRVHFNRDGYNANAAGGVRRYQPITDFVSTADMPEPARVHRVDARSNSASWEQHAPSSYGCVFNSNRSGLQSQGAAANVDESDQRERQRAPPHVQYISTPDLLTGAPISSVLPPPLQPAPTTTDSLYHAGGFEQMLSNNSPPLPSVQTMNARVATLYSQGVRIAQETAAHAAPYVPQAIQSSPASYLQSTLRLSRPPNNTLNTVMPQSVPPWTPVHPYAQLNFPPLLPPGLLPSTSLLGAPTTTAMQYLQAPLPSENYPAQVQHELSAIGVGMNVLGEAKQQTTIVSEDLHCLEQRRDKRDETPPRMFRLPQNCCDCGGKGRADSECPNRKIAQRTARCVKCGFLGHWTNDCTAERSVLAPASTGDAASVERDCRFCGGMGHFVRDCPYRHKEQRRERDRDGQQMQVPHQKQNQNTNRTSDFLVQSCD